MRFRKLTTTAGVYCFVLFLPGPALGAVRLLTEQEMKSVTGSGICSKCETTAGGSCPGPTSCSGGCSEWWDSCDVCVESCLTCLGDAYGCLAGDSVSYKRCRFARSWWCNGNNSEQTPCGAYTRKNCEATGGSIVHCKLLGAYCECTNTVSGDCNKSDCT